MRDYHCFCFYFFVLLRVDFTGIKDNKISFVIWIHMTNFQKVSDFNRYAISKWINRN